MSKIVKHNEFKKVVSGLWNKVKENFISDITYDQTTRELKKSKSGQTTPITNVITKWNDLEYVTESQDFNLLNPSTFEDGKYYTAAGYQTNPDWGNFKIPCNSNDVFTLFKKKHDSLNLGLLNNGAWVQNLTVSSTNDNGWVKYTINIPPNVQVDSISIPVHKQTNNYKSDVMVFSGDVNAPNEFIPFINNRVVSIDGEKVAITFDSSDTTLTSGTTIDAIKELDKKIVNAGGGTVTSVNNVDPIDGNVTIGINDIQNLQTSLDSKVNISEVGNGANQIPRMDGNGKLHESIMPSIAITDVIVIQRVADIMNQNVQVGDVVVVQDEGNKTYMCKNPQGANKNDRFIEINMGYPVVKQINGLSPSNTGAITIGGADINATVGGNVNNVQQHLHKINGDVTTLNTAITTVRNDLSNTKVTVNTLDNRLTNVEAKRHATQVGEIVSVLTTNSSDYTISGTTFLYLGTAKTVTSNAYPQLASALGLTNVNSFNLPIINDVNVRYDNGARTITRKHFICAKKTQ